MPTINWNKYSIELDGISKTLNEADIDARTIDINKYFIQNEEFNIRFKTMSYNGDLKSQDVLRFFKLNMSNKLTQDDLARRDVLLRMLDDEIACALVYKTFIIGEHVIGLIFLLATHKQHGLKKFARRTLGQFTLALMEAIKARQLKGGLTLSKCAIDLASFQKKCSFSLAGAPFSSWAERGAKMMCLESNMEEDDDEENEAAGAEEEKVPEKGALKLKAVAVKQTAYQKLVVAKTPKKIKKPLREKSAFEDDIGSSLSSDSGDLRAARAKKAKEGKPVQIDTSTIKVAGKIRKVTRPIDKPQPKAKTKATADDEAKMDSDNESERTTKSMNRSKHKHCTTGNCSGKLIKGCNWAKHTDCKHNKGAISYEPCTGTACTYCREGPRPKPLPVRFYTCNECCEDRRYGRFPAKDRSVCMYCLDGKTCRGSDRGLEKFCLKSAILDKLPKRTTQEQLNDSGSDSISVSMELGSSKRQKTAINVTVIEPEHIEVDIIRQLKAIEKNTESVYINASVIQDICSKFNKDLVIDYFSKCINAQVFECISKVLECVRSLSTVQVLGLLFASFALGHTSWVRATVTLSQMEVSLRTEALQEFEWQVAKHYSECIGMWCSPYWNQRGEDQFVLLKALKNYPSAVEDSILMIPLCSQVGDDVQKYIKVISSFVRKADESYQLLLATLQKSPKQMKITFSVLNELLWLLQTQSQFSAMHSIRDTLLQIPVAKWKKQIELAHASSTVIDGDTIQKSLNEFIARYAKPETKLAADLSLAGDVRFQFFTKVVLNPPNNKQFALAQYCIGLLKTHHRQMWCVPSGQGKGRIEHTLAAFALMLGFSKTYIFYPSKQLWDRDADEFSTYLSFVEKDQIQHCIGIDGVAIGDNELVILDEGDAIMHSDPDKFRDFISKCLCVCFTATPDDHDPRGVDLQVLKAMAFPAFYYVIDVLERIVKFDFDLELPAMPVTEKAAEVKRLSQTGPVVVHCTPILYEELEKLDLELVEADEKVNHQILRTLGVKVDDKFRVAVASMRGLDYRSSIDGLLTSLLIAKSFQNKREAMQGYSRVGRVGDKCHRVAFKDVDLIDAEAELIYKLNTCKFLLALSRKTIQMKRINVTDLTE